MVLNRGGGNVGIGTSNPGHTLDVNGTTWSYYGYLSGSDIKFKKNLLPISDALSKVLQLGGVSYEWKEDYYKVKESPEGPEVMKNKAPEGSHYGVIAQEIEKILPEVVKEGFEGTKAVAYTEIIPVLIEAIKEQQKLIEKQQAELKEIRALVGSR